MFRILDFAYFRGVKTFLRVVGLLILGGIVEVRADEPEKVGTPVEVTCTYEANENFKKIGMPELPQKGEYHYQLYLPKAYTEKNEEPFPILFVMDWQGGVKLNSLVPMLERLGCIGVGLQEAKNGPWAPIMGNFLAAHDDVVSRFHVNEERKFSTGHSGGARGASLFPQLRKGFAGIVLRGASYWFEKDRYSFDKSPKGLKVYLLIGKKDNNFQEVETTKNALPYGCSLRVDSWDGGGDASPEKLFEALQWVMSASTQTTASESAP